MTHLLVAGSIFAAAFTGFAASRLRPIWTAVGGTLTVALFLLAEQLLG